MLLAGLCFVHCVAGPALLSLAGLASLIHISEGIEPAFLLSSFVMGAVTLVPAYRDKHRRRSCLAFFGTGLMCFFARRYIHCSLEPVMAGLGAILIIGAHALNLKFSKNCQCCDHEQR
jgi:hypothetical protein